MPKTPWSDIAVQKRRRKTFLPGGIYSDLGLLNLLTCLIRYYATAVLDYVHRSEALAEWHKVAKGESVSLERALGSFDLFVLHDHYGDLLEVSLR
jgi:hypothetical protein